jgi:hypothetical protein
MAPRDGEPTPGGSGEGGVADDLAAPPYRDEAVADPALDVLGDELAKIAVERLNLDRSRHGSSTTKLR